MCDYVNAKLYVHILIFTHVNSDLYSENLMNNNLPTSTLSYIVEI